MHICIFLAYFFTYSVAYLAYWQDCILCIFCHMLHIIYILIYILFCISCIFKINMPMPKHRDNLKCLSPGQHCLLQLLLSPPSQGPAVHVPPSTTITTVFWFVTESTIKVSRFSSHGEGYCPGRAHWNQRKAPQYGGHWNHIQDLSLFTALVDDCRLTLIHPGWGRSTIRK